MKLSLIIFFLLTLVGCQTTMTRQNNPGGKAVYYGRSVEMTDRGTEIPHKARPNDATISAYEDRKKNFLERRKYGGRLYVVEPKGNAVDFRYEPNKKSLILEKELSEGFILSYLFYENGVIKYNGKAKDGRFDDDISDETRFFTHSTGKSIVSYIVGHAICEGYISSIDEIIDWIAFPN